MVELAWQSTAHAGALDVCQIAWLFRNRLRVLFIFSATDREIDIRVRVKSLGYAQI